MFSDFIGMAQELQASGYNDAPAVIAGSVLEDHLRKLATNGGLEIEKRDGSPKKGSIVPRQTLQEALPNPRLAGSNVSIVGSKSASTALRTRP